MSRGAAKHLWPPFLEVAVTLEPLITTTLRIDPLLAVRLRHLAHKLRPRHVHGSVDLAGLWPRVVLEDFHHQGRIIRDNNPRLKHAQEPNLALGFAERSRGIDRYIRA